MRSTVNQSLVINMVSGENAPYANGTLPVEITGTSSVYHGRQLPYFTEALAANRLTVDLDVRRALEAIGVDFGGGSS